MISERPPDGHVWVRVAENTWTDPLDDTFAQIRGGRWNPPDSWRTLYLNDDVVTARLNVRRFAARWPYEPEDLAPANGPDLVSARLPRHQTVADVHTPAGIDAVGLPGTYPRAADGTPVSYERCQQVGGEVKAAGLHGIRFRSTMFPHGERGELAWFPATSRSRATLVHRAPFATWYWA